MLFYIWKDQKGTIIRFTQTDKVYGPPAERVTEEEFRNLGFYHDIPEPVPTEAEMNAERIVMLEDTICDMDILMSEVEERISALEESKDGEVNDD